MPYTLEVMHMLKLHETSFLIASCKLTSYNLRRKLSNYSWANKETYAIKSNLLLLFLNVVNYI